MYESEEDVEKTVADLMRTEVPTAKAIGNYPIETTLKAEQNRFEASLIRI